MMQLLSKSMTNNKTSILWAFIIATSAIEDIDSIPISSTNDLLLSYKIEMIIRSVLPRSICVCSNRMPNHECKYVFNFVSIVKAFIQKTQ